MEQERLDTFFNQMVAEGKRDEETRHLFAEYK
jgi:hypothetical protein